MLVLYKRWKKYNEFQITKKKQNGLEQSRMKNHPPSSKRGVTSRDRSLGKDSKSNIGRA